MANTKLIFVALILCAITAESWSRSIETTEDDDDNSKSNESQFYHSNVQQSYLGGNGNGGTSLITSRSFGSDGSSVFIKVSNPTIIFDGKVCEYLLIIFHKLNFFWEMRENI
jgi:hypothetical protein